MYDKNGKMIHEIKGTPFFLPNNDILTLNDEEIIIYTNNHQYSYPSDIGGNPSTVTCSGKLIYQNNNNKIVTFM